MVTALVSVEAARFHIFLDDGDKLVHDDCRVPHSGRAAELKWQLYSPEVRFVCDPHPPPAAMRMTETHLEFVLVVAVGFRQLSELLRHLEAVVHVLRRHEVLGRFDAAVQVPHLQFSARANENVVCLSDTSRI